jgi:type IV secretion system protein VirB10
LLAATSFAQKSGDIRLPEGTRITLRLNDYLSTKLNSEGDAFTAEVIAPVLAGDRQVVPKGSIVSGSVSRVVRPGRFRGRAVMNVVFDSIRVPGKGAIPLTASLASVDANGNSGVREEGRIEGGGSKGKDAGTIAKPGAAGAGVGGLIGGGQGAAIGAGAGALVGLATVLTTRGKDVELRRGSALEIILDRPLIVPEGEPATGRRD